MGSQLDYPVQAWHHYAVGEADLRADQGEDRERAVGVGGAGSDVAGAGGEGAGVEVALAA